MRILYSDLDGTLVGRGGSLFADAAGRLTLAPARALAALHAAGIPLVLVSGRTRGQLLEASRLLGADGFVAELGALLGWDRGRSVTVLPSAAPAGTAGPPQPLVTALLAAFAPALQLHAPWHTGHEVDVLLRGHVDPARVAAWLAGHGAPWLRLRDNGVLPAAGGSPPVHVYHLLPAGLSKGRAVAADLARRGLDPASAVAIGDSVSDLSMAAAVGRFYLVANGRGPRHAPVAAVTDALAGLANVTVTRGAMGLGWAQAVRAELAGG